MAKTGTKRFTRGTKYPAVDQLKPGAMTVKLYADEHNISVAYVYIKHSRGLADYTIVQYQGVNWVQSA